ncbi:MAG: hypothetical protein GF364_01060 [Candidatus Lokiarchaeota archaeon]|nr:hypothetical protein [Candidatus Lokiarchaeota archaeon]
MIVDDIEKQKAKVTAALMMGFFGFSFILIGLLFGFLFEVYGLFAIAVAGGVLILIAMYLVHSSPDIGILDWFEMSSWETTKRCPKCNKFLKIKDVVVCPFCGARIRKTDTSHQENIKIKDDILYCANCNAEVDKGLKFCPFCGIQF